MIPQQTIAHYRITAKLGEGGMGEVYRATDTKLGREVAIKIIPESFAQDPGHMARFTREAHVLASLNHPNIAAIYGVEENAIVMELVEGEELRGRLPLDRALPLIHQLIDALEYAHEKGVVHRDLKPANVKITPEGRVKVLDFGLAKALASGAAATADSASSPTLTIAATKPGTILGTAAYMAPEQARGHNVDRRADIWAFGVVVWEMLTGRRLFETSTVSDTLAAVLTKEPDFDGVPAKMRRLLRVCLVKDPRKRLSAIGDARLEMDDAAAPATTAGRDRSRWWPALAALFALVALALAAVHFREKPPPAVPIRFQIPAPEKSSFGHYGMALSPDGRRLAFIANNPDGRSMLWVRPLDSLDAQALPGTEGANFLPFWSPDSRFIGFVVEGTLKKVDASGGPPQTLSEVPGSLIDGSWSSAGTIILSTSGNLFKVSQAGGVATPLTTPDFSRGEIIPMRPWFLPDGQHLLFVTRGKRPEDRAIYLATLDGKERKRLVSAPQAGAYAPPSTSSKNGHLLFLRGDTLMAQPMDPKRFELAGEPFPVAEQVGSRLAMGFFTVSANGVLAYRSGAGGDVQLAWFDRAGKSQGALGAPSLFDNGLALSPDGKRVAISLGGQAGNVDLWIVDVERGIPMRFTFDPSIHSESYLVAGWQPHRLRFRPRRRRGHLREGVQRIRKRRIAAEVRQSHAALGLVPRRKIPFIQSSRSQDRLEPVGVAQPGKHGR